MSETVSSAETRESKHDREIFLLAYSASMLLVKLSIECELCDNDLFNRVVKKLEKIKRITNETYDEIARVTNAAYKREDEDDR